MELAVCVCPEISTMRAAVVLARVAAVMYHNGRGLPQDYAEGMKWYLKSSDHGLAAAQLEIGVMYDKGLGVPHNDAEALKWYVAAANGGDPQAQFNAGTMFANAQGTARDLVRAYLWFSLAAAHGDQRAASGRDMIMRDMTS